MSSITSLISAGGGGGGGGGTPINGIAKLNIEDTLYTDENNQVWLKSGDFITSDFASYPDAETFEYNVAGDITSNSTLVASGTGFNGIFFKPDGTQAYIVDRGNSQPVKQYSLSTPYDITTAAFYQQSTVTLSQDGRGIYISNDGVNLFISRSYDNVFAYVLTTPWDISTMTTAATFSIDLYTLSGNKLSFISGLSFKPDGTRMYFTGVDNSTSAHSFFQFNLSTAWNLSTASYYADRQLGDSLADYGGGLYIADDQQNMYIASANFGKIARFTGNSTSNSNGMYFASHSSTQTPPTTTGDYKRGFTFLNDSAISIVTDNDIYQIDLGTAWNITTMSYNSVNILKLRGLIGGYIVSVSIGDSGNKIYLSWRTSSSGTINRITQLSTSTPYSIENISYAAEFTMPTGETYGQLNFKPDGTKVYYTYWSSTGRVYQRTLSTPWDISTAGSSTYKNLPGLNINLPEVFFKPDGTKMFAYYNTRIYTFDVPTPWDVTSITANPTNVLISGGTTAVVVDMDADYIYASQNTLSVYKMTTQWDPTTFTLYKNLTAPPSFQAVAGKNGYYILNSNTLYARELPDSIGLSNPDYDREFLRIK